MVTSVNVNFADAANLPRSTEAQVLEQVKKDIEEANKYLSWGVTNNADRAVRANKGAAFALLAHVHAWSGNYAASAAAADSVLKKGGYTYVSRDSYLNIFRGQSSEGVFEIAQNAMNEGTAGTGYSIPGLTLRSPFNGVGINVAALPLDRASLYQKFKDSAIDLRVKKGFAFFSSTDPINIKYSNIVFTGPNQSGAVAQNNMIVFRLADIALLKAEALAATNQYGEARTQLNQVRSLANLPAYTSTDANLFEAVIEERSRELFLEGHRFYDLVRLGRAKGILNFGGSRMTADQFAAKKYYWPIDPYLMSLNPLLIQTDYWKSRM